MRTYRWRGGAAPDRRRAPIPEAPASHVRVAVVVPPRARVIRELEQAIAIRSRALELAEAHLAARADAADAWVYRGVVEELAAGLADLRRMLERLR